MKYKTFKGYIIDIAKAESTEELYEILDGEYGVDMAFQHGKLTWKDHEILYALAGKHKAADFTVAVDKSVF